MMKGNTTMKERYEPYFDFLLDYSCKHRDYGVLPYYPEGTLTGKVWYDDVYACVTIKALTAWADSIAGVECKVQQWGGYRNKIFLAFKTRQVRKDYAPAGIQLCSYALSEELWEAVVEELVPPLERILGKGKPVGKRYHYYIWECPEDAVPVEEKFDEIVKAILAVVQKEAQ